MKYVTKLKIAWANTTIVNKLTFLLTMVIAGANTAYVFYARKQFITMSGQLTEMQSSGQQTDQLIGLYRGQVDKLNEQLGVLRSNVGETHTLAEQTKRTADIMQADQRPWVGLSQQAIATTAIVNDEKVRFDVSFTVQNFGKSPALREMATLGLAPTEDKVESSQKFACQSLRKFTEGDIWEAKGPDGAVNAGEKKYMSRIFGASNVHPIPKVWDYSVFGPGRGEERDYKCASSPRPFWRLLRRLHPLLGSVFCASPQDTILLRNTGTC